MRGEHVDRAFDFAAEFGERGERIAAVIPRPCERDRAPRAWDERADRFGDRAAGGAHQRGLAEPLATARVGRAHLRCVERAHQPFRSRTTTAAAVAAVCVIVRWIASTRASSGRVLARP